MTRPPPETEFVSILMLTYNAPEYVRKSIETVHAKTEGVAYRLVVVDNASGPETVELVTQLKQEGKIDSLLLSPENTLFAGGNNLAAQQADPASTHFLLLNSDIEVRDPLWLRKLLDAHKPGATSYGVVAHPPLRLDGYCFLIDADLYRASGGLNEEHQWWWGITRLQADLLDAGKSVQGWYSHDDILFHFGGKSGDAFIGAKGMDVSRDEVIGWFKGQEPEIFDRDLMSRAIARREAGGTWPVRAMRKARQTLSRAVGRRS